METTRTKTKRKREITINNLYQKIICFILAGFLLFAVNYSEAASVEETVYTEVCQFNPNPDQEVWIYQAIMYASAMYSVDPLLLTAVIEQESHFNISAFSPAGAVGLAQLMPSTANSIGVDPYDPLQNVLGGAKHLRTLLDSFDNGNPYGVTNAIAAYNAGSRAVIDNGGCPPYSETVNYVCSIAGIYNNLLSRIY